MIIRENILNLGYYVKPPHLRIYALSFGAIMLLSSLFTGNTYVSFTSFVISLFQFSIGLGILFASLLRKTLYSDRRDLFNTLTFFNKVLFRKKIDTELYTVGNVVRLDKNTTPWIKDLKSRDYDGFAIYLEDQEKTQKSKLTSVADADKLNRAIQFIHENSGIRFPKTHYKNHW